MTRALPLALIALAAMAAQAQTPAAAPQAEPGWTFVFKKGEVLRYRTYIKITARTPDDSGDVKLIVKTPSQNTTKEITPEGSVVWEQLDLPGAEAKINGMPLPADEAPRPVTMTLGKNGMILKRVNPAADPADMSQKILPVLSSYPVPPVGIKPGESWSTQLANPMLKNKTFTATSTLIGNETILGIDCLKVQLKMVFPAAYGVTEAEQLQHSATYWLDAKTRQLVRLSSVTKNPVMPFPLKNPEARAFVSRVVDGQNDTSDPEGELLIK